MILQNQCLNCQKSLGDHYDDQCPTKDSTFKPKPWIRFPGTETGPWSPEDFANGKAKPIYWVETESAYYIGNDLDSAMRLWSKHFNDLSRVLNVQQLPKFLYQ